VTEVEDFHVCDAGSQTPMRTRLASDDNSGASKELNSALRVKGSYWISARAIMDEGEVIDWRQIVVVMLGTSAMLLAEKIVTRRKETGICSFILC
jgi:hypothetical protein